MHFWEKCFLRRLKRFWPGAGGTIEVNAPQSFRSPPCDPRGGVPRIKDASASRQLLRRKDTAKARVAGGAPRHGLRRAKNDPGDESDCVTAKGSRDPPAARLGEAQRGRDEPGGAVISHRLDLGA
jgi:hypothetical protein